MGTIYDDYYNQAHELQNHFLDKVDNQDHPVAKSLYHEMHELTQDFRSQKDPRHMDERLKIIDHQLLQARTHGESVMSYQDIEQLQHQYRRLRENVRRMPGH